jgi:hypothetical protein
MLRDSVLWYAKRSTLIILGLFFFIFIGAKTKNLFLGPTLTIDTPKDGDVVVGSLVLVRGTTGNIATLYLNGHKIYINEKGTYNEELLVPLGYSIITVQAVDREQATTTRQVRLWRKE